MPYRTYLTVKGRIFSARFTVTRPLAELTAAARGFMDSSPPPLPRSGGPEVALLSEALQRMQDTINERDEIRIHAKSRLRAVFEAAPNAMLTIDTQRRIQLANRAAEMLFGRDRDSLIGATIETLLPERYRAAHPALVAGFFAMPAARPMGAGRELFALRADGTEVPVEIGLNPLESDEGPMTLASIIDISERKRAEAAQAREQARFREVVEAAPNAMLTIDAERRIQLVNRNAEKLFGRDRSELVGALIETLLPERYRAAHPALVAGFFGAPTARPMGAGRELFALRADDTEVPVEIGLNPIPSDDGLLTLASIIDISERRQAESTRANLAAIVESSDDAIVGKTLTSEIASWNVGAQHLFGYTAEEAVGQPSEMLVPERLRDAERELMRRVAAGEHIVRHETLRRHRDGHEIDVSVTLSPILGPGGTVIGVSSIKRDVTDLKKRDAELRRSNAELEQFAYVASHDLQEPLRMVASYTELLAERYRGKLDERADKYIHYASDGARRMQRLITDLLSYSRVSSQGKPLVPVDSGAVAQRVVHTLQQRIAESGGRVELGPLPTLLADEMQIQQLLQNLIGNALKFRGEALPVVTVQARREGRFWRFEVSDNGIGLDMRYAQRIFMMFQRLHEIGRYEGSGIGLAIAKRIVERHGGQIDVRSQPGEGTTFFFTLPDGGQ